MTIPFHRFALSSILAAVAPLLTIGCATGTHDQHATSVDATEADRFGYERQRTEDGSLVVRETVELNAPVSRVWQAYTTSEGFAAWAAPIAEVDLRPGGTIRTSYDSESGLDGDQVNTLRIVNFVPERLLTLQAESSPSWPELLKKDAANLYNVILFEDLGNNRTRVTSYGLGYTDSEDLRRMMEFFKSANLELYGALANYVEEQ